MARKHKHHGGDDDDGHKKHKKKKPPPKKTPPPAPKTVTEQLKETSTQSGQEAMDATPTRMGNPDDEAAIYSTGPGEVVVYGYDRQGQGAGEYALQQSSYTAPQPATAGVGQMLTPGAAGGQ
jgi:hypothetical protein